MDVIRRERHGVLFYFCGHPAWSGTAHGFWSRRQGNARGSMAAMIQRLKPEKE